MRPTLGRRVGRQDALTPDDHSSWCEDRVMGVQGGPGSQVALSLAAVATVATTLDIHLFLCFLSLLTCSPESPEQEPLNQEAMEWVGLGWGLRGAGVGNGGTWGARRV